MIFHLVLLIIFFPLQFLLGLSLLLTDLARFLAGKWTRKCDQSNVIWKDGLCSIVMLNYNGTELLHKTLPAVEKAIHSTGREHEILLVDNGSSDDSVAWVRTHHPHIRILELNSNLGFGEGNNIGVSLARHEIVVLLNNDMIVKDNFLGPLLEPFCDPKVFAVSSQIFFPNGKPREETGNTQAQIRKGYLHLSHNSLRRAHKTRRYLPVIWAGGGSSAYRRSRFLELGGFSKIFSPAYLEDTDLSYRAWRRGWIVLLASESHVLHHHRSTSSKLYPPRLLERLIGERKLWYLWKNFQLRTLFPHLLLYPYHLGRDLNIVEYIRAFSQLPYSLWLRFMEPRRHNTDRILFNWTRRPLSYLNNHRNVPLGKRFPSKSLRILVVSAYLPHLGQHGGAGRVFQLLRRLSDRHQIHLLSFVDNEREIANKEQLLPYCRWVKLVKRKDFRHVSLFPYEPFEEFNTLDFRRKFEEVLEEEDFDLIHFEWTQMSQYDDLLPSWTPRVLTEVEVNYAAHYSRAFYETNPLKKIKRYYETLQTLYREVALCRRMDRIICVTPEDQKYLEGFIPKEKLCVVPTGVNTSYFVPRKEGPEPNNVLFVGAFRHEPNVDAMIFFSRQVLPLLLELSPNAHLYIVGSGPPRTILEMNKHPSINVTGYVPDLREFYARAQVVVVPVRTGVGIRGKVLEAWAAGTAVVATPLACHGIRVVHGQNALVARNPHDLAMWISALLKNPKARRQLAKCGRNTAVDCYDWDPMAERLLATYDDLLQISRPKETSLELSDNRINS